MRGDKGSVTLWVLGLSIVIVGFGGVALDFWRALATQREIAAIADAASVAAASGIDEAHYRATGEVILDAMRSRALGWASIDSQHEDLDGVSLLVAAGGGSVEVTITDSVSAGFVGLFAGDDGRLMVRATSTASPRLTP